MQPLKAWGGRSGPGRRPAATTWDGAPGGTEGDKKGIKTQKRNSRFKQGWSSPSKTTSHYVADLWPWKDQLGQMCVSALTSYVKLCVVVDGRLTCQFPQTLLGTVVHHQAEWTVLYQQLHGVEKPVIHRLHTVTGIWKQAFSVVYDRLSLNSAPD